MFKKLKSVQGVNIVVDATGKLLTETLKYRPFLIKPNVYEMCVVFYIIVDKAGNHAVSRADRIYKLTARSPYISGV